MLSIFQSLLVFLHKIGKEYLPQSFGDRVKGHRARMDFESLLSTSISSNRYLLVFIVNLFAMDVVWY